MGKRSKLPSEAFSLVEAARHIGQGVKSQWRAGWACFLAILVCLMAPIFTAEAADHMIRTITFLSSGLKTAAISQSSSFDVSTYAEGQVFIDVTAEAGVSTLDVVIQVSPDNVTWYTHTTVAKISATGQTRVAVTNFGNYMRIYYAVAGTSMTFSVVGVFKN